MPVPFLSKEWPQYELDGVNARQIGQRTKLILLIWHRITARQIIQVSPTLADRVAAKTSDGLVQVAGTTATELGPPRADGSTVHERTVGLELIRERMELQVQDLVRRFLAGEAVTDELQIAQRRFSEYLKFREMLGEAPTERDLLRDSRTRRIIRAT